MEWVGSDGRERRQQGTHGPRVWSGTSEETVK